MRWKQSEPKHAPIKRYFIDPTTIPQKPELDRTPLDVGDFKPSSEPRGANTRAEFFRFYNRYLQTDYWKELRKEILTPEMLCESCHTRRAIQLHHRYYSKFGRSVLFHEREALDVLMPICKQCHDKRHPNLRQSP